MESVKIEIQDSVAVLKLDRSVTNPLNLEFLNEISKTLQSLVEDTTVNSLVIGSNNNKFFSIGFDIPELFELGTDDVKLFYQTFNRLCLELYTIPKPTIVALTGHAIAGGCILAICCDYRFIAEDRKLMGLNEVKLGLPVPYPADRILRELVGAQNAKRIVDSGDFYQPDELLQMGLVDQVVPLTEVFGKSMENAKLLGAQPHKAFAMIKRNRVEIIKTQILKRLEEKEQFFLDCWESDETRELLKEAIKKF